MKNIISVFITIALTFIMSGAHGFTSKQAEINKQNVIEFYDKAINQKDFEAASKYLGSRYTQHNPTAADGYVILHVHSIRVPGTRGRAIFDLFKLENGKIVEHWDAVQDIPEHSANSNGMF
jgi:predicted SnoaL-like aldol condensation-catalyzing enzyme